MFDRDAISVLIGDTHFQSVEYNEGKRFAEHLAGDITSERISNLIVSFENDGVIFSKVNSDIKSKHYLFCVDLTTCEILKERASLSTLLGVMQKAFRTTIKIWDRKPFSSSERINRSKSIIFPFTMGDKRRIVIERSNNLRSIESKCVKNPLLAYKYNDEDPRSMEDENVDVTILELAVNTYVKKIKKIQKKYEEKDGSVVKSKSKRLLKYVTTNEQVGRKDFKFWTFDDQYRHLTRPQKEVVDNLDINAPLRVDGAAGTGKTVALIMRAYKILEDRRVKGERIKIIFFAHSDSTCQRNKEMFECYQPHGFEYTRGEGKQSIVFITLLEYCRKFIKIPQGSMIEEDAENAKTYQLMMIQKAVEECMNKNIWKTYRSVVSKGIKDLFEDDDGLNVLYTLLQHEFSVQIKGRTNGTIDEYKELEPIQNGLNCRDENDKKFIFRIYKFYQEQLKELGVFDVDDVIIDALSRLNAPIWRRTREQDGYDAVFVDEMHLFNINEQNVFHFLTKDYSQKQIPICFALDYSQIIGDRGDLSREYISKTFKNIKTTQFETVFRNSPQIADFCAAVAASGTLMFQNAFLNPYPNIITSGYTNLEADKFAIPELYMYKDDEAMLEGLKGHIKKIKSEMQCKDDEIAIVVFEEKYLRDEGLKKINNILSRHDKKKDCDMKEGVIVSPYDVNGLEFKAVVLLGVDEGRLPQKTGVNDISIHFIKYSAYNLLYLTASRARYKLILLGSEMNGISSCLKYAIESKRVETKHI